MEPFNISYFGITETIWFMYVYESGTLMDWQDALVGIRLDYWSYIRGMDYY